MEDGHRTREGTAASRAIYYKVRDVVRRLGYSESETCRVFKDWHVELRVGSGHVSVWTSAGVVYLAVLNKTVYYQPGPWEEYVARLHLGRPTASTRPDDIRAALKAQATEHSG
jgi:DNA-binding IclR family transcriptional regulator